MTHVAPLAFAAALLTCCGGEPTQVMVQIVADEEVAAATERVEIVVRGGADASNLDAEQVFEFSWDTFPREIAIAPQDADADRVFLVVVRAKRLSSEQVLAQAARFEAFAGGSVRRVTMRLAAECLDLPAPCGPYQHCQMGSCGPAVGAPPSTDGGVDGGAVDDAGTLRDSGLDAGEPPADIGPDPRDMSATTDMGSSVYEGLILSEYVEGDSNNRAVEIYNGTGGSLDANDCELVLFRNGGAEANTFGVDTVLADGQTWVFCHSGLSDTSSCDSIESTSLNHNGDDAYAIRCESMIIDSLGDTLGDPGDAWESGGISTTQDTLRRACPPTPDTNLGDAFDPSADWLSAGLNVLDGLGGRSCPGSP